MSRQFTSVPILPASRPRRFAWAPGPLHFSASPSLGGPALFFDGDYHAYLSDDPNPRGSLSGGPFQGASPEWAGTWNGQDVWMVGGLYVFVSQSYGAVAFSELREPVRCSYTWLDSNGQRHTAWAGDGFWSLDAMPPATSSATWHPSGAQDNSPVEVTWIAPSLWSRSFADVADGPGISPVPPSPYVLGEYSPAMGSASGTRRVGYGVWRCDEIPDLLLFEGRGGTLAKSQLASADPLPSSGGRCAVAEGAGGAWYAAESPATGEDFEATWQADSDGADAPETDTLSFTWLGYCALVGVHDGGAATRLRTYCMFDVPRFL